MAGGGGREEEGGVRVLVAERTWRMCWEGRWWWVAGLVGGREGWVMGWRGEERM